MVNNFGIRNPIFVGGLMKSGSSLVRKLIGLHPNIYCSFETHWFEPELQVSWRDSTSERQRYLREFFEVTMDDFEALKRQSTNGTDFFCRFMDFCMRNAKKTVWLDKTPGNIFHYKKIKDVWPESRFIHTQRDLRDVFSSLKKNKGMALDDFLYVARKHLTVTELVRKEFGESYFSIRYEDLVLSPRKVLMEVFCFLGERWYDGLEMYEGDPHEAQKILKVTGNYSSTAESISRPIFSNSIGRWRTDLADDEIRQLEELVASELKDEGV